MAGKEAAVTHGKASGRKLYVVALKVRANPMGNHATNGSSHVLNDASVCGVD